MLSPRPLLACVPGCALCRPQSEGFEYDRRAYFIMVLMGVGVLLPWNVILNTLDFLDNHFSKSVAGHTPRNATSAYVWVQLPLLAVMVKVSTVRGPCTCVL